MAHSENKDVLTAAGQIYRYSIFVSAVLLAALLMATIEKRSFGQYYFPLGQAFGKRFWQGVPYGFALISLLLGLIAVFHGFSLGNRALSTTDAVKYGLLYGVGFILVGVFEEFSFRGYMQSTLSSSIGFWPAAILLSILFGALHLQNLGEAWNGALMACSLGLLAAFALKRTGNIWFAVGMHAAWDWGQTYFYSTVDSGFVAKGHLLNSSFRGPSWITGGPSAPKAVPWSLASSFWERWGSISCFRQTESSWNLNQRFKSRYRTFAAPVLPMPDHRVNQACEMPPVRSTSVGYWSCRIRPVVA